ncbi:MAG TPA: hypothetical protein VG013_02520 [Gemmataceae bacterium]|jgi:hypothetical protein|nr:hypothetical protein [Gemmataceae bacterium]
MNETTNVNREAKRAFESEEAARQHKPATDKWKVYRVMTPTGATVWTWAGGAETAIVHVAKAHGYAACAADSVPNKEKVAGLLAQLAPEDRAALLGQFAGTDGAPAQAPATEKAPGKKGK